MIRLAETAISPSDVLARIPYFSVLDGRTLGEIGRAVRRRNFAQGDTIIVEGKPCEGLFFVIRGEVRLTSRGVEGREHVLRVLGPGATFNEDAVFDGGPNSANAVATCPTVVGVISKAEMTALVDRYPEVAKAALKAMSARQRALYGAVEDLALRDVTTRVARLLLVCIGQGGHIVEQAPDACARITHQEIASMVGSVREVVQRALKDLERDGVIALERTRIRVRDRTKLQQRAHFAAAATSSAKANRDRSRE